MSKFVVGLTGGIGSGKSAVSQRFESLGIVVVDADLASRAVLEPGSEALRAVAEHFGGEVVGADNNLDRALLRQRVFADPAERTWLEQLTHPLIGKYLRTALRAAASAYVMLVNPLLVETGNHRLCNRVLVVDTSEALQLKRTMTRDHNSETQVRAIMSTQASRAERLAHADDVILNDRELNHLDAQVGALHQTYLELAT
ncbi:MAG: dephospho-CoA kinase [Gammaproteobacteria bacterium]|nr:MAG: dephospho-CoA kinase [Gammaproteobacteria bacterium]TDJ34808.1 MAG: dephospho-CoA kinase [Gammaproteobacteria bacterium]